MARRKLKQWPVAQYHDDELAEATVLINEQEIRRYHGRWCTPTQAKTWRPASWLGSVSIDVLLDHIHNNQPPLPRAHGQQPIAGQLDLLTAKGHS